jgi:alkylhydroperoxidase family enzyme
MKPRLPLTDITEVNVLRAMGNHPDALEAFFAFGRAAYWGGSLDGRVREIAWLGASRANSCHY